jgi:hypothetical protein
VQQGYTLYKVNEQTDAARIPHELVSETGAQLTFLRPLTPEELTESLLTILRQAQAADEKATDRLVLEVARALALNPLRYTLLLKGTQLDADAGKVLDDFLDVGEQFDTMEHDRLEAIHPEGAAAVPFFKARKEFRLHHGARRA